MSLDFQEEIPFATYPCSLGTVIGYYPDAYRIQLANGEVRCVLAQGELSEANVEADIAIDQARYQ